MNDEIRSQLGDLGISFLLAAVVWSHYRHRVYGPDDKYSTFGPRFWAGPVDSCILWPLGFIASFLLALNVPRSMAALIVMVESLAWILYAVLMHGYYGQTVGKMITKVRVVDFRTEGRISFRQAWLREGIPLVLSLGVLGYQMFDILAGNLAPRAVENGKAMLSNKLLWVLVVIQMLWFVAEVLTMLTNEKRRALHDYIAGTIVVRIPPGNKVCNQTRHQKGSFFRDYRTYLITPSARSW